MTKYIYDFHEGNKDMRALLGGKGANLAEMTNIGLSVPPGFTVTTEACIRYLDEGALWDELEAEIRVHISKIEEVTGKNSPTTKIHSWFPCVPAQSSACRA